MYVGNTDCKLSMSLNSNTLPVVNEVVDTYLMFHSRIDKIVARIYLLELNYQMFYFA